MEEFRRITGGSVFVNPLGVAGIEQAPNGGANQTIVQSTIHLIGGASFTVVGATGEISRVIGDRLIMLATHRSVER